MKTQLFFGFLVTILFFSCTKEDLTVTLIQNGGLAIALVDDSSAPIPNGKITLRDYNGELDQQYTDENGNVDFGKLNISTYQVSVEVTYSELEYSFIKPIQVSSGVNKNVTININDFEGVLNVKIRDQNSGDLITISGLQIDLVPESDELFQTTTDQEVIDLSVMNKNNSSGEVLFENVPSNVYWVIMSTSGEMLSAERITIEKDDVEYLSIFINPTSLIIAAKKNWTVSSMVYTYNQSVTADLPYSSIIFNTENGQVTMQMNDGSADVTGYYYLDYYYGLQIYWDNYMGSWNTVSFDENELVVEFYDYTIYENITMTLN
jgi:hypothetical protein